MSIQVFNLGGPNFLKGPSFTDLKQILEFPSPERQYDPIALLILAFSVECRLMVRGDFYCG